MVKWGKGRGKISSAVNNKRIITCKKVLLMMMLLFVGLFIYVSKNMALAVEEQSDVLTYLYVDTSLIGADSEIWEEGIGAWVCDRDGNSYYELPVIMEAVEGKSGIYRLGVNDYYSYVVFTKGSNLNGEIQTPQLSIDWSLKSPCFRFNSEDFSEGGDFYGLYTVYFDLNGVDGIEEFYENGVGVYAYSSETESCSSVPVLMKESDRGEGIYEYSFDKPYEYIAFMSDYGSWNYEIATAPVCMEWGYLSPCFVLDAVDGKSSTGFWRNLTYVIYFDASEIKEEAAFKENGVYLYAYNETQEGREVLSEEPVKMVASRSGSDRYEYTLDKPYTNVKFLLGSSLDEEIQSEVITIDWQSYAAPCYKMTLERIGASFSESPDATPSPSASAEATPTKTPSEETEEEPTAATSPEAEAVPTNTPSPGVGEESTETMSADEKTTPDVTPAAAEETVSSEAEEEAASPEAAKETVSSDAAEETSQGETLKADTVSYTSEWRGAEGTDVIITGTTGQDDDEEENNDSQSGGNTEESLLTYVELTGYDAATTATVAADVGIMAASASADEGKTVYFYTTGNGGWNSWTKDCTMYIYYNNNSLGSPVAMTKSTRQYTLDGADADAVLWEYTVPANATLIIFVNSSTWTGDGARQTVDITLSDYASYTSPCFALDGNASGSNKTVTLLGDLGVLSEAGSSIYFFDMTSLLDTENVYAVFGGDGLTEQTVSGSASAYIIPDDVDGVAYSTVTFYDGEGNQLGATYQFFDDPADGEEGFLYDEDSLNTFYYGVTEKADGTIISTWGEPLSEDRTSLGGQKLYFSKIFFPVADGGRLLVGQEEEATLVADEDDEKTLSFSFAEDSTATSKTILTFIDSEGSRYHFLWSDFGTTGAEINLVTLEDEIAAVTETYVKANTVYFDATMSKLSYYGTDGAKNSGNGIPYKDTENVYYYATGDGVSAISGKMEKAAHGTWTDVYKVDLPEGYTSIRFAGYSVTNTNTAANGDATDMWTIPTDLSNPCFYADTSDSVIYDGGNRSGYWAEVYTIRDAEAYKTNEDVVDIASGDFVREANCLYVTSTFYDYYTDYELNGSNRDNYGGSNGASNRNWVNFRQFNQALSDYYEENSVAIPIYTGHFQPSEYGDDYNFANMNATLQLYGYSNYRNFISTNNSGYDIYGNGGKYAYAAQGLVESSLVDDELIVKNGTVAEPHFNKDFLTGNNSKNAVLGEVYENVAFPFVSVDRDNNGVKYWYFDSAETTLAMHQDTSTGQYYLEDVGNDSWSQNVNSTGTTSGDTVSNKYGFFPFNETAAGVSGKNYNYGFGTKLEFVFRLTADGTVQNNAGEDVDITFEFSGDDDVWVFIDGELALDVGGDHGTVEGQLDFRTLKATVSAVKASAGSTGSGTKYSTSFSIEGANTDEHTLTMFYMERGMWESNMMISFNFPDENQLSVEKEVDESDVNQELFAGLFDGANIFTFVIKNLATHYGTTEADTGEEVRLVYNDSFAASEISAASSSNTFAHVAEWEGQTDVVHWKALYDDASSSYRSKRYGVISPSGGGSMDVSGTQYLQFKYYYDESDTPALNHMYIAIEDTSGDVIVHRLSGAVYGSTTMKSGQWATITIDLSKFAGTDPMDWTSIAYIKFGYDYEADFYLDEFVFKSSSAVTTLTGFVTKQYDIPDYGSATSGQLEYPVGAVYTLTTQEGDSSYYRIGEEGTFVLADGDTVLFRDQFRRGSYIYLEEEENSDVFDTVWTMYENGQAVATNGSASDTVEIETVQSLTNVSSYTVDDGRAEIYVSGYDEEGQQINNTGYTKTQSPEEPTFVFRSYSSPDDTTGMTKLKVVYTNKVKTGSLSISKEAAIGSDPLEGEYTVLVTFTNVAGMALEGDEVITKTITLKAGESETIEGIPINTEFTIVEITPDQSFLYDVEETNGQEYTFDAVTKEVNGKITTDETDFVFTLSNMLTPTINIAFEKKWENADGTEITEEDSEGLPESLTIRLQRREAYTDGTYGEWQDVILSGMDSADVVLGTGYERSWSYSFTNLDKYVDNTAEEKVEWEYRIVEIQISTDEEGNEVKTVVEDDSLWESFQAAYTGPLQTDTEDEYTYTITNTHCISLRVLKKDMTTGEALEGVSFQLQYKVSDDTWQAVTVTVNAGTTEEEETDILTTGESGSCKFADLPYGEYRLIEVKTLAGYTLLKEPVAIVLDREGSSYTVNGEEVQIEDNTISITITNSQNLVLPSTGGGGIIPMLASGIGLCCAAGLGYLCSMRKKRK